MEMLQTVRDFFEYSEGNVFGLYVCLMISLGSILLFIFSFPLEKALNGVKGGTKATKPQQTVSAQAASAPTPVAPTPVAPVTPAPAATAAEEEYLFCKNCGQKIKKTAKFCTHCGAQR